MKTPHTFLFMENVGEIMRDLEICGKSERGQREEDVHLYRHADSEADRQTNR